MSAFQLPAWPSSSLFLTATRAALPKLRQILAPLCSSHTTSLGRTTSQTSAPPTASPATSAPATQASLSAHLWPRQGLCICYSPRPESLLLLNFCEPCPLTFFRDLVKTVRARQLHLKPYLTAPSLLTFPTYHLPPITFQHTILFIVFTRV